MTDRVLKPIADKEIKAIAQIVGGLDLNNGPWIAGGCARRLWYGLTWKYHDVDVFFPTQSSFDAACLRLNNHITKIEPHGSNELRLEASQRENPYVTEHARTYQIQIGRVSPNIATVQAVCKTWHGSMDAIFNGFDMTVCKFATDGTTLVAAQDAIRDCDANILRSNRELDRSPGASRIVKYSIYGFEPTKDIMINLLESHRNGSLIGELMQNDDY
jgi:hypothetical protein